MSFDLTQSCLDISLTYNTYVVSSLASSFALDITPVAISKPYDLTYVSTYTVTDLISTNEVSAIWCMDTYIITSTFI